MRRRWLWYFHVVENVTSPVIIWGSAWFFRFGKETGSLERPGSGPLIAAVTLLAIGGAAFLSEAWRIWGHRDLELPGPAEPLRAFIECSAIVKWPALVAMLATLMVGDAEVFWECALPLTLAAALFAAAAVGLLQRDPRGSPAVVIPFVLLGGALLLPSIWAIEKVEAHQASSVFHRGICAGAGAVLALSALSGNGFWPSIGAVLLTTVAHHLYAFTVYRRINFAATK